LKPEARREASTAASIDGRLSARSARGLGDQHRVLGRQSDQRRTRAPDSRFISTIPRRPPRCSTASLTTATSSKPATTAGASSAASDRFRRRARPARARPGCAAPASFAAAAVQASKDLIRSASCGVAGL